jgi:hypothetical protein
VAPVQAREVATLAGGLGLCVVLPGFAAARFLVGTRHPFDLAWQTVLFAVLVFTPLTYPTALLAGAPTLAAVLAPLLAFAALCWALGRRQRAQQRPLDASPRWLWAACGLWWLFHLRASVLQSWCPTGDVPWFVGTVRELASSTPAQNPELYGRLLSLPSGYWFWYACVQRFTGLETKEVLFLLGGFLSVVLLVLVQRVSHLIWRDQLAAIASLVLLVLPCDSGWLRPLTTTGPESMGALFESEYFGYTLLISWYHGPALVLLLLVIAAFVLLVRWPQTQAPLAALLLLLVVFPFHHPMYYGVALSGLAPYLLWAVFRKRTLHWPALLAFLTWLPWKLLSWAWPEAMLQGDVRFTGELTDLLTSAGTTVLRHALLLPLAWFGLRRASVPGIGALASLAVVLFLPGPWAGWNPGWNPHWQWSPLLIVLALFAGAGVAALVRLGKRHVLLLVLWVLPNVALLPTLHPWNWPIFSLEGSSECPTEPGLRAAAEWLRKSTPRDATIAAAPSSSEGDYVEMYGARRLAFGRALHFDFADPEADWRPVQKDMARVFEVDHADQLRSILARRRIDYVVLRCPDAANCAARFPALFGLLPQVFRSDEAVILAVPAAERQRWSTM